MESALQTCATCRVGDEETGKLADPAIDVEDEVNSRAVRCGLVEGFDLYSLLRRG